MRFPMNIKMDRVTVDLQSKANYQLAKNYFYLATIHYTNHHPSFVHLKKSYYYYYYQTNIVE